MIYAGSAGPALAVARELAIAALGWILLAPLTWILPRDATRVVFFGRDGGKFIDNCKHLYIAALQDSGRGLVPVYIVADAALRDALRAAGGRAEIDGGPRALWAWLRAGTLVVDSVDWTRGMRLGAARGARLVQLWHGIPLKHVKLARTGARRAQRGPRAALKRLFEAVTGRYARSDWFLSTSAFVTARAFAHSFVYDRVSHAGYPRNDALFGSRGALTTLGVDAAALQAIEAHGGPVVLYAPTFREAMNDPFADGTVDPERLSAMARSLGALVLVKLHPWMHGRLAPFELPGVRLVAPASDIYPLLRRVDALVTDYSSIFFDFLLLDQPVVFFAHDLARYLEQERAMYFDYGEMTPGPKVATLAALEDALRSALSGDGEWRARREHVRGLVFEHRDGHASQRLLDELFPRAP